MEEYQKRMQEEFMELDNKVNKLMDFFHKGKHKELNLEEDEVVDMRLQLYSMQSYRDALGRRCARKGIEIPNVERYIAGTC